MKLQPNRQFAAGDENVAAILAEYGVVPDAVTPAASGIENSTLFVVAGHDSYVLRIYRRGKKSLAHIRQELAFIDYLAGHDVPVAAALPNTSGSNVTSYVDAAGTWQAILMLRVPGDHAAEYTPALLHGMATTQATLHLLAGQYVHANPPARPLLVLREDVFGKLIDRGMLGNAEVRGLLARSREYEVILSPDLPSGLAHLDYDKENVLCDALGNVTAVLDFDDLAPAPFVVCLGYCLWDIAAESGTAAVYDYLSSYEAVRPLTPVERRFLNPVMLFRHYVIASADVALGVMDELLLQQFVELETQLRDDTLYQF